MPSQGIQAKRERAFVVLFLPVVVSVITLLVWTQVAIRQMIERQNFQPVSATVTHNQKFSSRHESYRSVYVAYEVAGKKYDVKADHEDWVADDNPNYSTVWVASSNPGYATLSPMAAYEDSKVSLIWSLVLALGLPLVVGLASIPYVFRGENSVDTSSDATGDADYRMPW